MSDKYIIKNCDAFCPVEHSKGLITPIKNTCINYKLPQITQCENITDCKLKQIVELCKGIKCPCEYKGADCWECTESGARRLADRILQLLDVQEVE